MIVNEEDYIAHYGILRRSGRYPWGSGGTQNVRNKTFLGLVDDLRKQGLSETDIAQGWGISTTQLRAAKSMAKNQQKQAQIAMAQALKDKGNSTTAIAKRMGIPESSARALLAPGVKDRADVLTKTSSVLKKHVDEKKYIDIGTGVESHLGVSKEKLAVAVAMLQEQGYEKHSVKIRQVGTGLETTMKVLAPPGTTQREVWENRDKIRQVSEFSQDGGRTFGKVHDPLSVHPNRIGIKYKEDGGDKADGVIYVREGVPDISLGKARYAQVRIQVGEGHYLKGMAMYKDDLPKGTDLVFNTNKSSTGNKFDAMKEIKADKDFPFGAVVRQILADPGTPHERVTSAMNIVGGKPGAGEEGGWSNWSRNLSSQFLSKQSPSLIKAQLGMTHERRQKEFEELTALTNPTVKRKLLESFADDADSASVHLKSAALPRSNWHPILPIPSMRSTEVYAPNYKNGERVVLIRYPHGGTFEIPELTVNNRHPEAKKLLGNARDAIGIHHSVAERLSGADFDGDTVLVIPNNAGRVKHTPALSGLKNFDVMSYKIPEGSGIPKISARRKQQEMGNISNLITDMTLKGAPNDHLARAIRHSMVVIDAEKHGLNYKLSEERNGIKALKTEYQGGSRAGAATLISRKKSDESRPELKPRPQAQGGPIDRRTGARVFVETGATRRLRDGTVVPKLKRYKKLALTEDAHTLSSGTPQEKLYADHSNRLKTLANQARLAAINTPTLKYSPSAKKIYAKEVSSLESKLALVVRNRPLERQAQVLANAAVKAKRDANPNLDDASIRKIRYQEETKARQRTGAVAHKITITPDEWNAVQAGAITENKLRQILDKSDLQEVRAHATPRKELLMTPNKTRRAQQMLASGYTRAEVAKQLGVSLTTLDVATV